MQCFYLKNWSKILLVSALFLWLMAWQKEDDQAKQTSLLQAQLDSVMSHHSQFSGVVLAAVDGQVVYHRAFGFRDYDQQIGMQPDDMFELASVSKQFTTMSIMLLAEERRLGYDDPLEKFLPELPYKGMTIRQLMHHTAGLPDYMPLFDEHWDKTQVADNEDIIEYLVRFQPPVLFAPGEQYAYSNTAYVLLASIVERASGEDFTAFLQKRIFQPLGMSKTGLRSPDAKKAMNDFAWGYTYIPDQQRFVRVDSFPENDYAFYLGGREGPGRISSNATDLLRWDQALYSGQLVTASTLDTAFSSGQLTNGTATQYGFGWMVRQDSLVGKTVMHTGDNPGYRTKITRFVDQHRTLIFLCNNQYAEHEALIAALEKALK